MLNILTLVLVVLTIPSAGKQDEKVDKNRPFCGFNIKDGFYYSTEPHQYITREGKPNDPSGIPDVIIEMKEALGIEVDISVFISKDEDNCFAMIGEGGRRMIVADHHFLNRVNEDAGTRWAAISILAHELGHHIAGFSRYESSIAAELDADYWSGYILQKLGSAEDAATKCILYYGTEHDSDSHPNKYDRAATIREGWQDGLAGDFEVGRCEGCGGE